MKKGENKMKQFKNGYLQHFLSKPQFNERILLAKDNQYPRMSVVVPSYNQGIFLERTLLSILNQNYPNLEVIVIDGGSQDGSIDIIKKYERFISYWVSEKDNGQTHAINKGMKKATGVLIGWQNSDDVYLPGVFERVAKLYQKHPYYDVFFGNMYFIDTNDFILDELRFVPFSYNRLIYEGTVITNQASFISKKKLEEVGYLREEFRFTMDYDLWLRLGENGKFCFVREFWGAFRLHGESKTSNISHIGNIEHEKCLLERGFSPYSFKFKFLKIFYLSLRILRYILQGDAFYVLRAILRKMLRRQIP